MNNLELKEMRQRAVNNFMELIIAVSDVKHDEKVDFDRILELVKEMYDDENKLIDLVEDYNNGLIKEVLEVEIPSFIMR